MDSEIAPLRGVFQKYAGSRQDPNSHAVDATQAEVCVHVISPATCLYLMRKSDVTFQKVRITLKLIQSNNAWIEQIQPEPDALFDIEIFHLPLIAYYLFWFQSD